MLGLGKAFIFLGNDNQADFFLRYAAKSSLEAAMLRVGNNISLDNESYAKEQVSELINRYPVSDVFEQARIIDNYRRPIYASQELSLQTFISKQLTPLN